MGAVIRYISRQVFSIATMVLMLAAFNGGGATGLGSMDSVTHGIRTVAHGLPIEEVIGMAQGSISSTVRSFTGGGASYTSHSGPIFIEYQS